MFAVTLLTAHTTHAQSVNSLHATSIGLPGCASDVPVAASRSVINFTSQDRDISALLYEPQGIQHSDAALVILHGYQVRDDVSELDGHAIQLASRGYAVILPFYLRPGIRGDDPTTARNTHRAWRRIANDAATAVAAEMKLDSRRVLLWGKSRGGGVALATALEPDSTVGGAVGVNIGGAPQDDAVGTGRLFLLAHPARSARLPPREVMTMAERIQERGGIVERMEVAADHDQFATADWCRIMDGTRGLLERLAVASPRS